eukprot:5769041-Pleurochrysis_carterae.AAC.4
MKHAPCFVKPYRYMARCVDAQIIVRYMDTLCTVSQVGQTRVLIQHLSQYNGEYQQYWTMKEPTAIFFTVWRMSGVNI